MRRSVHFMMRPGTLDTAVRWTQDPIWEVLPVHPKVAAQPTIKESNAKTIRFLQPHNGVMLFGYGDWFHNTGPVSVSGYDIVTGEPVVLKDEIHSEALDRVRIIDGAAYAPWVDPVNHQVYLDAGGYTTDRSGVWENVEGPVLTHCFDMRMFKGSLYMSGSAGEPGPGTTAGGGHGVVYRIDQDTNTWELMLEGLEYTQENAYGRFYDLHLTPDDTMLVQCYPGPAVVEEPPIPTETYETSDGENWVEIAPEAAPRYRAYSVDEQEPVPARYAFGLNGQGKCTTLHDGMLWVGGSNGLVARTPYSP